MKLSETVIRILLAEGVDTVFSLLSEDILGLTSTMSSDWGDDIEVVETRHEEWALAMADGYARASGEIGVCIVGRGPAVAHGGTALVTAEKHGSSVLVLVPESPIGASDDIKGFPGHSSQQSFLEAVVGTVAVCRDAQTLVPTFENAFRRLHAGRGPVVVQVPWDVLERDADDIDVQENAFGPTRHTTAARLRPDGERVRDAVSLYLDSDASVPPVILAGRGAVEADAKRALAALAERTSAVIATTLRAHGYFADHPYSLGFVGTWGAPLANEYLARSDFVFALGCSLNDHTTDDGRLVAETTVVQVDVDPATLARTEGVALGIVGDAKVTADCVLRELRRREIDFSGTFWTDALARKIAASEPYADREYHGRDGRVDPREVVRVLDHVLPDRRLVVLGAGHFSNWILDGFTIPSPDDFLVPGLDFGSIGIGFPCGLGAAYTTETRRPVVFCGDAGFLMSISEVETAARLDVPIVVVVMNDGALSAELRQLEAADGYTDAAVIGAPNFSDVATSFGATGHEVRSTADLWALADRLGSRPTGPVVVDCKIDRNVTHPSYDSL